MGVLVFLLALVPFAKKNQGYTMHLMKAESPGPDVAKLVPKIRNSAAILYFIYIGLTILNFLFLLVQMPVFDAVCTAFSTAGTGGFGIKADGFASFSPYVQIVTTVFMALFGINFSCYYLLILKQVKSVLKDEELRLYFGIILASIALIAINTNHLFESLSETIRHSAFQVSSIITTTGFASVDFDLWPNFSKAILLFLMLIGASAGSTGGGLKCARLLLIVKTMKRNISQLLHPNRVKVIKVNNNVVDEKVLSNTNAYLAAYVIIMVISFLVVSIDNLSYKSFSITSIASWIS
jgi:trk system potassium uptake protein TrkH